MAELMASYKSPLVTFKKGDQVTGKITKLTRNEIRVDIQAKAEAIVLEKDRKILQSLMTLLHVGDEVTVSILSPEAENGLPVVSLRRFVDNKSWDSLAALQKKQELVTVTVTDLTKGGYIVVTDAGTSGFLPNSHMSFRSNQQVAVGQKLQVSILELHRKENKIIFSQKSAVDAEEFVKVAKSYSSGQKISAPITSITAFGLFLSLPTTLATGEVLNLDGLIHISEIAWEKVNDLQEMFSVGQLVEAVVTGVDGDSKRVNLSIKRLSADPFEDIKKKYPVDTKVTGTVTAVDENGVAVAIAAGVTALIKKEKVPPSTTYTVGQEITVTVTEIDTRRHRVILSPVLKEKPLMYR